MAFNETCHALIAAMLESEPNAGMLAVFCDALEEDGNSSCEHYRNTTRFRISIDKPWEEANNLLLRANNTFYMRHVEDVAVMLTSRVNPYSYWSTTFVYFNDCLYRKIDSFYTISYDKEIFYKEEAENVPMIVKAAIKYWKNEISWPKAELFA